jgi:antitoxin component YwqK of YwqJK toxin-antitoxin module
MSRYILLSFLLLSSLSFAQRKLEDFHLRRTLKQDGLQYQFNVLDQDKRGTRSYSKEKFYYWYKSQGIKSTQGQSSGLLLNGLFEGFYENDQLSEKGDFKKGLKQGEWMYWRSDGSLITSERWSNGTIQVRKTYDRDGQLVKTVRSKGKVLKGDAGDTTIIKRKFFKTETRYYCNPAGQTQRVESWSSKQQLKQVKYFEDGKLDHIVKYKDGEEVIKEEKPEKEKPIKEPKVKEEKGEKKPKGEKEKKEKTVKEKKPKEEKEKKKD